MIKIHCWTFITKECFSFFALSEVQIQKTQESPYDPTKVAIQFVWARRLIVFQILILLPRGQFLSMTWCTSLMRRKSWLMYTLVAVLLSTLKLLQTSKGSTENGKTLPDPVKKPSASQMKIPITVLLLISETLITFWTRTIYGIRIQQLFWHFTTLLMGCNVQSVPSNNSTT